MPTISRQAHRRQKQLVGLFAWALPIVMFVLVALLGPLILPYNGITTRTAERLRPPGSLLSDGSFALFGTDQVGRDLLAQVLQGARISMLVGASVVLVAGLTGLALGLLAGYYGGWLDSSVGRLADIQLGFPTVLLAILIAAVLGPSVVNVIVTLSVTRWVTFQRVTRGTVLQARDREYVQAARALGANDARLLLRHILPATLTPLSIIATVEIGAVIVLEASLSFLGLGTPSDQPSWGLIVATGRDYLNNAWWISTIPGLAIGLLVIVIGLFGDRLRDYLDPRSVSR